MGRVIGIERIGINDNFFGMGGHSLLATQIVSRMREVFSVDMPLRGIFETPTIKALAERIDVERRQGLKELAPAIEIAPDGIEIPLSFAQQRLWFLDQLEPGNPFYNIPAAFTLTGQLNLPMLEQSFNVMLARHESLRTSFVSIDGRPRQIINEHIGFTLPIADLTELSKSQSEAEAIRLAGEDALRAFKLETCAADANFRPEAG